MSHRQAALFGGLGMLLLVGAVIATVYSFTGSGVADTNVPPSAPATTTVSVATTTVPTTTTSTVVTSTTSTPVIGARAFIASDLNSGTVLASRRSTEVWPLASLTKLMTATIALREIAPDEPITIVAVPGGNPSAPGIPVGSTFAMRDVLSVMLVASSNEAAESLAAHVGREKFLAEMNAQAASWGLVHTQYTDPTGLSASNRSTAREIFTIAQHVYLDTPNVFATTRKGSVTVHALETGVPYTAYATHQLVRDPGFLGGKTGYTDEAKGNLLSLFQIGSQVDALIVLGSGDRFGDTRRLKATLTPLP